MLGISVYLNEPPAENQEAHIRKMRSAGFRGIFTSLHIPEDDPGQYADRLRALGQLAASNKMELTADISPASLGHLGLTFKTADRLLDWGVTGLRVDYGISEEETAALSHRMTVALNASTLTGESIRRLKECGLRLSAAEAWHNFYPRPETGLGWEDFTERNRWLRSEGLKVMEFVPGDGERRGPLYKGLPTLEAHRDRTSFSAYLDLLNSGCVDHIYIGDPSMSGHSLEQFNCHAEGIFLLRAAPAFPDAQAALPGTGHTNRLDAARDVIRSAESRLYGNAGDRPVEPANTAARPVGAVTIDNSRYGRYQGELQITKRDLPSDEKVNVVGRIIEDDLPILPHIRGGSAFRIRMEERPQA
ncbi:hypothetical protein C772_02656 [Bhargavaea cecembensis DSE10]|uniref:Outer surface protein n=1 Tax=Bhargavaea cecembensis DSE10 TaxID=1235279 RepID=M7NA07_9BACL|nr:MupG family TIM beta-alpha barrel fold protein [Bhargavaea cecembensis]EMR05423.1 hypothetical protein C772_02656 [Bhargavaea cecembensis DSE10]